MPHLIFLVITAKSFHVFLAAELPPCLAQKALRKEISITKPHRWCWRGSWSRAGHLQLAAGPEGLGVLSSSQARHRRREISLASGLESPLSTVRVLCAHSNQAPGSVSGAARSAARSARCWGEDNFLSETLALVLGLSLAVHTTKCHQQQVHQPVSHPLP